ncbi:hypothetical protein [Propionicicella superfundia]|nr:hypothetical protein [Propionicicella superfundia]
MEIVFWLIFAGIALAIVAGSITIIVGREPAPLPIPIEDSEQG